MTDVQFLNAVALGQITPGPVVHTVAVVGYAAAGLVGGLLAALVAFAPSFSFILLGAERFDRLRANRACARFLDGAGPAAIGAIAGAAVPLALALSRAVAVRRPRRGGLVLLLRRGVVLTLHPRRRRRAPSPAPWARPYRAEPALSATSSPCKARSRRMSEGRQKRGFCPATLVVELSAVRAGSPSAGRGYDVVAAGRLRREMGGINSAGGDQDHANDHEDRHDHADQSDHDIERHQRSRPITIPKTLRRRGSMAPKGRRTRLPGDCR